MFLLGDFNINVEQSSSRASHAQDYLDMLSSMAIFPIITKPPRVTTTSSTMIDHIVTNKYCTSHGILPGVIKTDSLADHYPMFCIIRNSLVEKSTSQYYYQSMKNFNSVDFTSELAHKLSVFHITDLNVTNINEIFDQFLEMISKTINTYAPSK